MNRCVLCLVMSFLSLMMVFTVGTNAVYDGMSYQGKVITGDSPFDGTGSFLFAVLDESSAQYLWSNDGNYPPSIPESITVTDGIFNVILGEPDMEPLMTASLLTHSDLVLRIWFDDGTNGMQLLSPDQPLTSALFAGRAAQADEATHAENAEQAEDADTVDGYNYSVLWPTTLTTVKAAASNDFHNLGGTDDDIPDTNEVSTSALQNDSVTVDKLAHYIDATGISFDADMVDGMDATDFATYYHTHWGDVWSGSGNGLSLSGGTAGIIAEGSSYGLWGETSSTTGKGVYGRSNATTGITHGVYGYASSNQGRALYGYAASQDGETFGVLAQSVSDEGIGVKGFNTSPTGTTYGVYGESQSSDGGAGVFGKAESNGDVAGVYGLTYSTSGSGVLGEAGATSGIATGVEGLSSSSQGYGVSGINSASSGTTGGVYGESDSSTGNGVHGVATSTSGLNYGVRGDCASNSGYGVGAFASSTSGYTYGVYAKVESSVSRAVYGWSDYNGGNSYGVHGRADSNVGAGVLAENYYNGAGLQAFSYNGHSIEGYSGSPSTPFLRFYVDSSGNSYVDGAYQIFKRMKETDDGMVECRTMDAISSTGSYFEDFGFVEFNGTELKVDIDPDFAQMVNLDMTYHVFLTQEGGFCPLYVAERTPDYFIVKSSGECDCSVSVHYRLVAKRAGSENKRMERIYVPAGTPPAPNATREE